MARLNTEGGGDPLATAAATAALCIESSPAVGKAAAAVLNLLSDDTAEDSTRDEATLDGAPPIGGQEYTADRGKDPPTLVTTLMLPSVPAYQEAGLGYGLRYAALCKGLSLEEAPGGRLEELGP